MHAVRDQQRLRVPLHHRCGPPYRRGPGAACASVGNHEGKAAIWCSKYNPETGNLWYYARDISSNTVGWVWAGNVQRTEGSNHAGC
ncbi:hypothetical protein ABZS29_23000 [Kribbella sp. NPDC005582]|uniref:hypothetical protein n=1 Tax=Kribbella sp. NPDC005582 TaxID=3156893 RepID=UPI0033A7E5D2